MRRINGKCLAPCLADGKRSVNVSYPFFHGQERLQCRFPCDHSYEGVWGSLTPKQLLSEDADSKVYCFYLYN